MSLIFAVLLGLGGLIVEAGYSPLSFHLPAGIQFRSFEGIRKSLAAERDAIIGAPANPEGVDINGNPETVDQQFSSLHLFQDFKWNQLGIFELSREISSGVYNGSLVKGALIDFHWFRQPNLRDRFRHDLHIAEMVTSVGRGASTVMAYDVRGYEQSLAGDFSKFMPGQLNRYVGAKLTTRVFPSLPKGPHQQSGAKGADDKRPKSITRRFLRGIRGLPLSAKVGLALVVALVAPPILFGGAYRVADGGSYRVGGLLRIGAALVIYSFGVLFWAIAGGAILSG